MIVIAHLTDSHCQVRTILCSYRARVTFSIHFPCAVIASTVYTPGGTSSLISSGALVAVCILRTFCPSTLVMTMFASSLNGENRLTVNDPSLAGLG